MSDLMLKVSLRNERGKQNKKIRRNKRVPAVVYGAGQKNISFSLDIREAEKYSTKEYENKIFTFDSEDKNLKGLKVIKKALFRHKVNRQPIHMDFFSLDMKKPIRVHVDIHFKGTPKGVREEGGVFNIVLRSVEIECLPDEIPSSIELDVSHLSLNQSCHVSDLSISKNIKLITKAERALGAIVSAEEEEAKTDSSAEGTASPSPSEEGQTASGEKPAEQPPKPKQ